MWERVSSVEGTWSRGGKFWLSGRGSCRVESSWWVREGRRDEGEGVVGQLLLLLLLLLLVGLLVGEGGIGGWRAGESKDAICVRLVAVVVVVVVLGVIVVGRIVVIAVKVICCCWTSSCWPR